MVKSKKGKKKSSSSYSNSGSHRKDENLDDLNWLRECEVRHTASGDPFLQLEYQDDDELIVLLHRFLEESAANKDIVVLIF